MLKEIQLIPVPNYDVCYGDYYLENNKLQQINVNHITGKIKFDKNKLNSIRFYGISNEEGTVDDEYAFLIDNSWAIAMFDEILGPNIQTVKKVVIRPEQIGLSYYGEMGKVLSLHDRLIREDNSLYEPHNVDSLQKILENKGKCWVEMENDKIKLINNKAIISLKK